MGRERHNGRRSYWTVALAAPFLLLLAGLQLGLSRPIAARAQAPSQATVQMHEFMFCVSGDCSNNTATIQAGGTVTWTWNESASDPNPNCDTFQNPAVNCPGHTTTAADKTSSGQPLWTDFCKAPDGVPGCPYTFTFTKPGTYHYYCIYHGGRAYGNTPNNPVTNMDGTVVVVAAASTASNAAPASSPTPSPVALAVTGGGPGAAASLWAEVALGAGVTLTAVAVLAGRRVRRRP